MADSEKFSKIRRQMEMTQEFIVKERIRIEKEIEKKKAELRKIPNEIAELNSELSSLQRLCKHPNSTKPELPEIENTVSFYCPDCKYGEINFIAPLTRKKGRPPKL